MPRGESTYTIPGTFSWVCPAGVTSVSVVCVGAGGCPIPRNGGYSSAGGGALAWANNITVTPGTSYSIVVGDVAPDAPWDTSIPSGSSSAFGRIAGGGYSGAISYGGNGGSPSGTVGTSQGGGNGGKGGDGNTSGGGGAGGYSGDGGLGGSLYNNAQGMQMAGSNGAGGGGGGGYNGGGGGVGLNGQGSNGVGQLINNNLLATGGSGGASPIGGGGNNTSITDIFSRHGGRYGGGASRNATSQFPGGQGAVRIVWPGNTRSFPSTDVSTP